MDLTRKANLWMGIAGAIAAWASNSQALLIDGLFSLIGYVAAVYAMRISKTAHLGADRRRPFGYAAEEALYSTFRSLALIGLVLFGIAQAGLGISDYFITGHAEDIRLVPVLAYTLFVATACFWLAHVHHTAWKRTGQHSDILKLEATAAIYDGIITMTVGAGLLVAPLLSETFAAPIAPLMDSLIVLILCSLAMRSYFVSFGRGVAQLAGAPAAARDHLAVRHALKRAIKNDGGRIVDVALIRAGRKLDAVVYYDAQRPVQAEEIDGITAKMKRQLESDVGPSAVLVVLSALDRAAKHKTTPFSDMTNSS